MSLTTGGVQPATAKPKASDAATKSIEKDRDFGMAWIMRCRFRIRTYVQIRRVGRVPP